MPGALDTCAPRRWGTTCPHHASWPAAEGRSGAAPGPGGSTWPGLQRGSRHPCRDTAPCCPQREGRRCPHGARRSRTPQPAVRTPRPAQLIQELPSRRRRRLGQRLTKCEVRGPGGLPSQGHCHGAAVTGASGAGVGGAQAGELLVQAGGAGGASAALGGGDAGASTPGMSGPRPASRGRTEAETDRSPRGDVSAKSPASEPSALARPLPRNSKMGLKSSQRKTAQNILKTGSREPRLLPPVNPRQQGELPGPGNRAPR